MWVCVCVCVFFAKLGPTTIMPSSRDASSVVRNIEYMTVIRYSKSVCVWVFANTARYICCTSRRNTTHTHIYTHVYLYSRHILVFPPVSEQHIMCISLCVCECVRVIWIRVIVWTGFMYECVAFRFSLLCCECDEQNRERLRVYWFLRHCDVTNRLLVCFALVVLCLRQARHQKRYNRARRVVSFRFVSHCDAHAMPHYRICARMGIVWWACVYVYILYCVGGFFMVCVWIYV